MRLPTFSFCILLLLVYTTQAAPPGKQPSGIMSVSALSNKSNKPGNEKLMSMPLGPQHNGVARTKTSKKSNNNNTNKKKSKASITGSKRSKTNSNDAQTEAKLLDMIHDDVGQGHGGTLNNNDKTNDFMSQHQTWLTQDGTAGKMIDSFRNDPTFAVSEKQPQHGIQGPNNYHHPENTMPMHEDINHLGHTFDHGHLKVMDGQNTHRMEPPTEWGVNAGRNKPVIPFHSPRIPHGMPPRGVMIDEHRDDKRIPLGEKYSHPPRWNNHGRGGLRWKNELSERQELPNYLKQEPHPESRHLKHAIHGGIDDNIKIHHMSPRFPSHHVPKDDLMPKRIVEQEEWYTPHQTRPQNFQNLRVGYHRED